MVQRGQQRVVNSLVVVEQLTELIVIRAWAHLITQQIRPSGRICTNNSSGPSYVFRRKCLRTKQSRDYTREEAQEKGNKHNEHSHDIPPLPMSSIFPEPRGRKNQSSSSVCLQACDSDSLSIARSLQ